MQINLKFVRIKISKIQNKGSKDIQYSLVKSDSDNLKFPLIQTPGHGPMVHLQ